MFFFQAEDGIRDLVRSRGLGDVYKRQGLQTLGDMLYYFPRRYEDYTLLKPIQALMYGDVAVSYTHLTLPTSDLV